MTDAILDIVTLALIVLGSLALILRILERSMGHLIAIEEHLRSRAMRRLCRGVNRLLAWFRRQISEASHNPIKYPRISRALDYMMMYIDYLYALYFCAWTILFIAIWGFKGETLPLLNQLGLLGCAAILTIAAQLFFADGNRRFVALRQGR